MIAKEISNKICRKNEFVDSIKVLIETNQYPGQLQLNNDENPFAVERYDCCMNKLNAGEPENPANDRGNHNRDDGMRFPHLDGSIECGGQ